MRKESTESRSESRPEWEQLEDWVRSQVQRLIQELLEEEVTAFLGRAKSALRSDSDSDTGYRNGYGRARRLTLSSGTIQLRRPRVRDTEEQFESRLLPLFVNRTRKVAELIPELEGKTVPVEWRSRPLPRSGVHGVDGVYVKAA